MIGVPIEGGGPLVQLPEVDRASFNLLWILMAGFLVMLLQAGFALVAAGLCRAKNAAHVALQNLLSYALTLLGFWACGFALMCGGVGRSAAPALWPGPLEGGVRSLNVEHGLSWAGHLWGLFGGKGFCLDPAVFDSGILGLFLIQAVFATTAAAIPAGVLAERWRLKNLLLYGVWAGALPYALYGNWVWGGGWLAGLGATLGLGHGQVDFAGSSVVHLCGATIAWAGVTVLGPRLGKYAASGKPRPIQGHNLIYVVLGTFLLGFGWFGLNSGAAVIGLEAGLAAVAVNTILASAAATISGCLVMLWGFGKPDPSILSNAFLGGLVAIAASGPFVSPPAAVLIGAGAGALVVWAVFFFEAKLRIDDPVGALSVHGVNGLWGMLSVGLFANGSAGAGWNGVHRLTHEGVLQLVVNDGTRQTWDKLQALRAAGWVDQGVTGALGKLFGAPANDPSQLLAQLIGVAVCLVGVGAFAWAWFRLANRLIPMRSARDDEIAGLDGAELGVACYPDYQVTDKSSPRPF